jgi:hypothetical protein
MTHMYLVYTHCKVSLYRFGGAGVRLVYIAQWKEQER